MIPHKHGVLYGADNLFWHRVRNGLLSVSRVLRTLMDLNCELKCNIESRRGGDLNKNLAKRRYEVKHRLWTIYHSS